MSGRSNGPESERVYTGKRGRPPHVCPPGLLLAQVVKSYAQRHVVGVARRVALGSTAAVTQVLITASGGAHQINTAYIERLNATFRACLAPLARRTRALAHGEALLTAGMFLVGTAYNFVWCHASLRLPNGKRDKALGGGTRSHGRVPESHPCAGVVAWRESIDERREPCTASRS